jgi:hypothetical protein
MCKIQKLKLNNFVESFYRSGDESTGRKVFGVPTNRFEEKRIFINGTVLNLFTVNLNFFNETNFVLKINGLAI